MCSIPNGDNCIFKDTWTLILFKNDRNVRFVLFTKTSNVVLKGDVGDGVSWLRVPVFKEALLTKRSVAVVSGEVPIFHDEHSRTSWGYRLKDAMLFWLLKFRCIKDCYGNALFNIANQTLFWGEGILFTLICNKNLYGQISLMPLSLPLKLSSQHITTISSSNFSA